MATTAFAIETRKLSKRYEETLAVDRLDLRIQRGEVFGLLGPNGAGKTTTILMLLGLTEPTDGVALVDGLVPQQDPLAVKRRIGYLPDDVGFYDDMTGRQNLRYTAAPQPAARRAGRGAHRHQPRRGRPDRRGRPQGQGLLAAACASAWAWPTRW